MFSNSGLQGGAVHGQGGRPRGGHGVAAQAQPPQRPALAQRRCQGERRGIPEPVVVCDGRRGRSERLFVQ